MQAALFHRILVATMQHMPPSLVWKFSRRYIAGTRLTDALDTARKLNDSGCSATIDVLGEDSTRAEQVLAARDMYLRVLDGIQAAGLDCNISVKLSEMGLRMDAAECADAMRCMLAIASEHDNFVRIDMEDSSVTTATLEIYRKLRADFDNVGVAIQSCLRRTEEDVASLLRGGPTNLRLCKGIYIEPEEIAYRDADDIRESFRRLLVLLLEGGVQRVGIATHDPLLIGHAEKTIRDLRVPTDRYEFQMLLGVAGRLRRKLIEQGHPLRVYVPFGALWFNYSMRRLRENPHIVGHIIRNLFRRQ
jgi:proline dehydrogenase